MSFRINLRMKVKEKMKLDIGFYREITCLKDIKSNYKHMNHHLWSYSLKSPSLCFTHPLPLPFLSFFCIDKYIFFNSSHKMKTSSLLAMLLIQLLLLYGNFYFIQLSLRQETPPSSTPLQISRLGLHHRDPWQAAQSSTFSGLIFRRIHRRLWWHSAPTRAA